MLSPAPTSVGATAARAAAYSCPPIADSRAAKILALFVAFSSPSTTADVPSTTADVPSGPTTADVRSGPTTADVRSGPTTDDVRSGSTTADVRSGPTTDDVRSGPTTDDVRSGPTTGMFTSGSTTADVRSGPTTGMFTSGASPLEDPPGSFILVSISSAPGGRSTEIGISGGGGMYTSEDTVGVCIGRLVTGSSKSSISGEA